MDKMLFWSAFGAIGTTLGAFATATAVIVALWQTKHANKKKLKVTFTDDVQLVPADGDFTKRMKYVGITVTNIGNRKVKLINWRLVFPDNRGGIIVQDTSPLGKLISPPWPMILESEDQTSQYWDKNLFYAYLLDEVPKYSKKDRNKKIVWIVKDSTGRNYKTKSQKTLQQYLDEAIIWKREKDM